MSNKVQRIANKNIRQAGGRRMIFRKTPITKKRGAWDMTEAVKREKKKQGSRDLQAV